MKAINKVLCRSLIVNQLVVFSVIESMVTDSLFSEEMAAVPNKEQMDNSIMLKNQDKIGSTNRTFGNMSGRHGFRLGLGAMSSQETKANFNTVLQYNLFFHNNFFSFVDLAYGTGDLQAQNHGYSMLQGDVGAGLRIPIYKQFEFLAGTKIGYHSLSISDYSDKIEELGDTKKTYANGTVAKPFVGLQFMSFGYSTFGYEAASPVYMYEVPQLYGNKAKRFSHIEHLLTFGTYAASSEDIGKFLSEIAFQSLISLAR